MNEIENNWMHRMKCKCRNTKIKRNCSKKKEMPFEKCETMSGNHVQVIFTLECKKLNSEFLI